MASEGHAILHFTLRIKAPRNTHHQQARLPSVGQLFDCCWYQQPVQHFISFHSATQFRRILPPFFVYHHKTGFAFCTLAFQLKSLSVLLPDLLPNFLISIMVPELASDFCTRLVEPRRCDLAGDLFRTTKQTNQATAAVDEVRAPSLRHLAPGHSRSECRGTDARCPRTHRSSSLCGAEATHPRCLLIMQLTLLTSRRALPLRQASPQLVTPATIQALQQFQSDLDLITLQACQQSISN